MAIEERERERERGEQDYKSEGEAKEREWKPIQYKERQKTDRQRFRKNVEGGRKMLHKEDISGIQQEQIILAIALMFLLFPINHCLT